MTAEWRKCRWGQLATLEYGKGLEGYENATGMYRVFGTNGPIGWTPVPLCQFPTVIVGRKGAYRGIHYSPKPCFVIDTAFYLSPKAEFDMRWAYYELLTHDINGLDTGSAIPSTTRDSFYDMQVDFPSFPEQKAIAHILGTLDDRIEANRRITTTLEMIARALFKSWFVDMDTVRGKAQGTETGLPRTIVHEFPDSLEATEFGEIPFGWGVGSLAHYAALNPESWSRGNAPEEIEYVDLANTKWGVIEATQKYQWKEAPSRAQRVLRPGDTIVGTVRPGNGSFALVNDEGLTGSTGFAVLRPRKAIYREFVYLAATASGNIDRLSHLADGAAYPAVRPDVVLGTRAVVPSDAILERFSATTKPMVEAIAAHERESLTLAELRRALLPKLISGELRVKDADRILGRVV